ncbi:major capsid protein [Dipodfec virus RodF1_81]|uniref:Major capsid protein n=1 Tax=Dipodfec virus RodF1_81 TaxID=2929313 RepID=A0A976N3B2_9VIRU|nr:major capsid protein [Dipodfec virus RodF1_81]
MSIFNSIKVKRPGRNRFNLSHQVKTTIKFGGAFPFICLPVVPGDTLKEYMEFVMRFAPFTAPVMHNINVYTHFFFVPNRLVWDEWEDFITQGETGEDTPVYPTYLLQDVNENFTGAGSLIDYLGFPVNDSAPYVPTGKFYEIDALPVRAYNLIYNEYYRDQNYTDEIEIFKNESGQVVVDSELVTPPYKEMFFVRNRAWKKDYFTSALPWPQRGPDVMLPIQGDAPLKGVKNAPPFIYDQPDGKHTLGAVGTQAFGTEEDVDFGVVRSSSIGGGYDLLSLNPDALRVDMSNVSSATINELRRAIAAQQFYEARARGGSRYIEQIYSIFGVKSSDARLQRPEYLGGGKSNVVISDVLQTSQTTETSAQATPSGTGIAIGKSHSFKRFFEEHGWVIGIMSVVPKAAYQQGMNKLFLKKDPLEYYWPQFAHLGEQEIKTKEIFYTPMASPNAPVPENEVTFGYTPRYAEYKFMNDSVHGSFRNTLDFWHMGRIFKNAPSLNTDFLTNFQSASRPFAVTEDDKTSNTDKIWVNIQNNLIAVRPMPKYGTPRII